MEAAKSIKEVAKWLYSFGAKVREESRLSNDLSQLQKSLPRARLLIHRAEWGSFKNKDLAEQLSQLRDTTYDAEDLLREFDDQALRQKLEKADRNMAGQLLSSSLVLLKSWITGSKTRVKEAQSNLDKALAEIEGALNFMGLNVEPVQLMPETSSLIGVPQVFGRDDERDEVIEMLGVTTGRDDDRDQVIERLGVPLTSGGTSAGATRKREGLPSTSRGKRLKGESSAVATETHSTGNVSVLPIVGIGGVGKTTLAQLIYNDARVKAHFTVRIWVCVSDHFDKRRITKEITESMPWEGQFDQSSLDALQRELMKRLMGKKFLLVLDDIWRNANNEWEAFFAPLRHGIEGSMVLVTTRCRDVADHVTTVKPVQLEGLPNDIFWEFFKKCAFGEERPELYPQLLDIGQNIADRLCGSPLAAKTLGRLLRRNLSEQHWKTIKDSKLWELQHEENDILPALRLSYLYLPPELKRCFAVCSMFPKDYKFERHEIVEFWVAQGFVKPGRNIRLEEMGCRYLDDLRSRFLFQTDPEFFGQDRYIMHDLIHDMAQTVSLGECFFMQDSSYQNKSKMPETVRHMSIEVDDEALSRMGGIQHFSKLHSLRFGTRFKVEISWFNQLSNILFLSLKGCQLVKLPEGLCVLSHLRYLDISHSSIQELPEKFWCLHSLQVFDASHSYLKTIHQGVTELVNLRHLALPMKAWLELSRIRGLGNLSSLRNLSSFSVGTVNGRRICELKGMNQLSGTLCIKCIDNVHSTAEAAEVGLVDKQYLKTLVLQWRGLGCHLRSQENEVLEALRPPSSIERLKVENFGGDISPSWLKPENLPTLRILELYGCQNLKQLALHGVGNNAEAPTTFLDGTPGGSTGDDRTQHASISSDNGNARLPFTGLTTLCLALCTKLTNLDQFLSPNYLPSIKSIQLSRCTGLVSLPVHNFVGFVCLEDLKIHRCDSYVCPREIILPHSLKRLSICDCGELDKSFWPGCLENLASLTLLHLEGCCNVESILFNSISTNNLKCLVLRDCSELSSVGGVHAFSSIQHVEICNCPKLTEVHQPLLKKGPMPGEDKELNFIRRIWY